MVRAIMVIGRGQATAQAVQTPSPGQDLMKTQRAYSKKKIV